MEAATLTPWNWYIGAYPGVGLVWDTNSKLVVFVKHLLSLVHHNYDKNQYNANACNAQRTDSIFIPSSLTQHLIRRIRSYLP